MLNIGTYTGTHGLKGEIKILSDFSRKDLVFVPGFKIYINDTQYIIETHRKHKTYDMVTLKNINDIKDIIDLRGSYVYINESDLNNVFLEEDLIDYSEVQVYQNNYNSELVSILDYFKDYILVFDETSEIYAKYEFVDKTYEEQLQENLKLELIKEIQGKNHFTYEEFNNL